MSSKLNLNLKTTPNSVLQSKEELETENPEGVEPTLDDCFKDNKIYIEGVTGLWYSRAKHLFRDTFNEVLTRYREILDEQGIPIDQLDKVQITTTMRMKKKVDPANQCQALCKTGKQCAYAKKIGKYCGRHANYQAPAASSSSDSESSPASENLPGPVTTRNPQQSQSQSQAPFPLRSAYKPKTESETTIQAQAMMEEIDGKDYIVWDKNVYAMPQSFDPEVPLDETKLDLVGTIRESDGKVEWLVDPTK